MVARVKAFLFELFDSYERTINFWLLLVLLTCAFPVSIFPAELKASRGRNAGRDFHCVD